MANQEQLDLLKQGSTIWNAWRYQHLDARLNLSGADLGGADLGGANLSGVYLTKADLTKAYLTKADLTKAYLSGANLSEANLFKANLSEANLFKANLSEANLSEANLISANLIEANFSRADLSNADLSGADLFKADLSETFLCFTDLSGANLSGANLSRADLSQAYLSKANLSGANLSRTTLVGTNLTGTTLKDCNIYGISAWDVQLDGAEQFNLSITPENQPTITVDNLKIAQFIYLLLNNKEIRDIIDTIAKKAVLVLGRFTPERKPILDAIRERLRQHDYLPILFDFENPQSRDVTETVRTLAHMARFIIADLTDPSSIPLELETIVPHLEVPVQPLLLETNREFSMFASLRKYPWVLPLYTYKDLPSLLTSLENLLSSAEKKADQLAIEKARRFTEQS